MKRILLITALIAILIMAILIIYKTRGTKKATDGVPQEVVTFAYLPTSSCLPLFVAIEKGYFKAVGIDAHALRFTATNDALNAVLAGRADGTPGFGLSSYFAIEAKNPGELKIYLPCVEDDLNCANYIIVPKNSILTSIEQLDGKKVGTYTSSTQLLYLKLMMQKALPPGHQWQIIQVDEKLQLQALVAGQFDALFVLEPNATIAINQGLARILVKNPRGKYIFSPFPAGANCFSSAFIRNRPKVAEAAARVFVKAVNDIRSDPQSARQVLIKYTPIEPSVAGNVGLYTWWLPGEEDIGALQLLANLLADKNLVSKRIDVNKMLWYTSSKN